eukprot:gnl/TRDRNA2_/TRDRNA2_177760_c5_seq15.p1 gnl/TRDRNA2_/TRDRNA2_177760_c5~~gnl/TRDRNA2_/TRDRNA2_177760_c5_seq15.p1  ORF type:complete len:460 (+),score=93.27 gnl/TRDRNA2_/TRDRNA2_177760_c5_seq15:34-1413(+)
MGLLKVQLASVIFQHWDVNGDGKLDLDEVLAYARGEWNLVLSKHAMMKTWKARNFDGIPRAQFNSLKTSVHAVFFGKHDLDNNGFLERDEVFDYGLAQMGVHMLPKTLDKICSTLSKGGAGEFMNQGECRVDLNKQPLMEVEIQKADFEPYDHNGNAVLDKQEVIDYAKGRYNIDMADATPIWEYMLNRPSDLMPWWVEPELKLAIQHEIIIKYDKDGDGFLDRDEIAAYALAVYGSDLIEENQLDKIYTKLSLGNEKGVSVDRHKNLQLEIDVAHYERYDKDGDGYLQEDEILEYVRKTYKKDLPKVDLDKIWNTLRPLDDDGVSYAQKPQLDNFMLRYIWRLYSKDAAGDLEFSKDGEMHSAGVLRKAEMRQYAKGEYGIDLTNEQLDTIFSALRIKPEENAKLGHQYQLRNQLEQMTKANLPRVKAAHSAPDEPPPPDAPPPDAPPPDAPPPDASE